MELINQILYSIIQGITEFLPISSSGHLAITQNILGEAEFSFDIFLHFATLLAIITYFHKDIFAIIKDFFSFKRESENFKLAIFLIIATLPIAIFGLILKNTIEKLFSNLLIVGFGFIISGLFLFTASLINNNKKLGFGNTFIIGLSQALALIPGISRSGSTTSTGILLGLNKEKAVRFSFLLAIPAIIGASLLNFTKFSFQTSLILPFIITFIVGIFSIHIFLKKIKTRNLRYFAYYCWFIAIISLTLFILKI